VGHLPYEEVPEEFNRAVGEFLSGNSAHNPTDQIDAPSTRC